MKGKRLRRNLVSLAVGVMVPAVVIASLFYVNRSARKISISETDWPMPGGGPSHASYLPFAPRGNLRELWGTRLEEEISGPPAVVADKVFAGCRDGFLYCLDLENGRPLWKFDAGSEITSMPVVFQEGVLLSTMDGRVICVDSEGERRWEVEVGGPVTAAPLPGEGRVFFGSRDGFLYCVDARDGSRKWLYQADGPIEVSPCLHQGQVLGVSFEGSLFALDADDGRLLWTSRLQGIPVTFPVADEGRVFQATEFELHCADAQSGKRLWTYRAGPSVVSNPAVKGNQVIIIRGGEGEFSRTLALDVRTGDLLWEAASGETDRWTNLFATNRDVYLAGPDQLRALELESGTPSLGKDLEGVLPWTLTVSENYILAGTAGRKVFCLGEEKEW